MEARKLAPSTPRAYQLSLRIRHPSMDPADITRELGLTPEHAFKAGDARPSGHSLAPASVYPESYWLAVLKPQGAAIDVSFPGRPQTQLAQERLQASEMGLNWALSLSTVKLLNPHVDLLQRIKSEGGEVSLLLAISGQDSSFTLAPQTSHFFGRLGITLEVVFGDA
jgi:hypothetical protein